MDKGVWYRNHQLSVIGSDDIFTSIVEGTITRLIDTEQHCDTIGVYAFVNCNKLEVANFPACELIYESAFAYCRRLISLYLPGSSFCTLLSSTAFNNTPIAGNTSTAGRLGSIYVPAELYDTYVSAENWSYFSERFVSIES